MLEGSAPILHPDTCILWKMPGPAFIPLYAFEIAAVVISGILLSGEAPAAGLCRLWSERSRNHGHL